MSGDKPNDYDELAFVCRSWWRSLNARDKDGNPIMIGGAEKPRDREALAKLRRIDVTDVGGAPLVDVGEALGVPAFRDFAERLRDAAHNNKLSSRRLLLWLRGSEKESPQLEPFAIAAATLARIRSDSGGKDTERGEAARLLGAPRGEGADKDDHLFAEARFKRLIRTRDDWPDLMNQARRVAAILEREAPIGDLGASLILWNADPTISRDWAFQYYGQREFEPADSVDERTPSETTAAV